MTPRLTPIPLALLALLVGAEAAEAQTRNALRRARTVAEQGMPPVRPGAGTQTPPSAPATTGAAPAGAAVAEQVLFAEDFSGTDIGEFPASLEFGTGNLAVVEAHGRRWLQGTGRVNAFRIPFREELPDHFTLGMEILQTGDWRISVASGPNSRRSIAFCSPRAGGVYGGSGGTGESRTEADHAERPVRCRVEFRGTAIKVSVGDEEVAHVPNADFGRTRVLEIFFDSGRQFPGAVADLRVTTPAGPAAGTPAAAATPVDPVSPAPAPAAAPVIASVRPASLRQGGLLTVTGRNLQNATHLALVDEQGGLWPSDVWRYDPEEGVIRARVPEIPHVGYRVAVSTDAGTAVSADRVQLQAVPMEGGEADAGQKLRMGLQQALDDLRARDWLSARDAAALAERVRRGQFTSAGQLLDEATRLMVEEAEALVGGPVSASIVLIAMRTGKPIREIAQQWRHCHSPNPMVGRASLPTGSLAEMLAGDRRDAGAILDGCLPGQERYHSHVVPGGIAHGVAMMRAAQEGTRPPTISSHMHTELGFADGLPYHFPEHDTLLEDIGEAIIGVAEWCAEHPAVIGAAVTLVAAGTLCVASAGSACAAVAGPAMKALATILVDSEAVPPVPGMTKEQTLARIERLGL